MPLPLLTLITVLLKQPPHGKQPAEKDPSWLESFWATLTWPQAVLGIVVVCAVAWAVVQLIIELGKVVRDVRN